MTRTTIFTSIDSPLGSLLTTAEGRSLTGLYFPEHRHGRSVAETWEQAQEPFAGLTIQLEEYFAGSRDRFELELSLAGGTSFQQAVWEALLEIPHGATTSYRQLADAVGRPSAVRAVAGAVARNPLSIVVPCHRVIGSDGGLTGYAGGVERKSWLLSHEAAVSSRLSPTRR